MQDQIKIRGARQHNLKNINLDIPKYKLVVLTGVSGSGKSSLAFDTLYAEGQRRYVESLSTYARQFLGIMEKPDVDLIEGLSPAISIDQKTTSKNPRSTVGTVTEIYDYLRLLFARVGHPHCPLCNREISSQSIDQITNGAIELFEKEIIENGSLKVLILSPVVKDKKGEFSSLFSNLKAKGYTQVRIDNRIYDLGDEPFLIKTNRHTIEVVIDRISFDKKNIKDKIFLENLKSRVRESSEQSLNLSDGLVIFSTVLDKDHSMPKHPKSFKDFLFSERFACPVDNIQIPEIEPRTFSFNSPHGACAKCDGIGKILKVNPDLVLAKEISITEGGILPFSNMFENNTWYSRLILKVCEENDIDPRIAIKYLSKENIDIIFYGTKDKVYRVEGKNRFGKDTQIYETFYGIVDELEKKYSNTESDWVRSEIGKFMKDYVCSECGGKRLKKEALSITIDNKSISDVVSLSITDIYKWILHLKSSKSALNPKEFNIASLILDEINTRLDFLVSVGLDYISLDRSAGSLSGGEAQRIRLASQIGSGLSGVLYVLDEPTIGLHAKDNYKLINTLKKLRNLGNTVIVVEHDKNMIECCDYVIDFGPGAGNTGGSVVFTGKPNDIKKYPKSITGQYLSGRKKVSYSFSQNPVISSNNYLTLNGCSQYNLKDINVNFPLGKLVVVTGVSGSGKSTLLVDTLYPALKQTINPYFKGFIGKYKSLLGTENTDRVILIDQSPIGKTPRSNPATYTKVFDYVREVFSNTKTARSMGYKKGRFSFNVKGGRCEVCQGQGQIKIEMQFMSDIWVKCDTCNGKRYNSNTLVVEYNNKNISEVLDMTISDAVGFFHAHYPITKKLETLQGVGLGYMQLGQSATTLSGGEAQRIKLSLELSKNSSGKTVYILDEPTTGLHFDDVNKLLKVLKILVHKGNSVFIIEHNMDIIKNADWIIDLGPDGGDRGGYVVKAGTLKDIKKTNNSHTGKYLNK